VVLPAGVQPVLDRALAKRPDSRYLRVGAFAMALLDACREGSLAPEPVGMPARGLHETRPRPRPGRRLRGPVARLGALGVLAALALGAWLRAPARAPVQVVFAVRGSSLAVSFEAAGAEEVALELDGLRVETEWSPVDGRARLVYFGLPLGRSTRARLVWRGGAGPETRVAGEEPMVGAPAPLPGDRLVLECRRPGRLAWRGSPLEQIEPGPVTLTLPAAPPYLLEGEDDGVPFSLPLDEVALHGRLLEDLEEWLAEADLEGVVERCRRGDGKSRQLDMEPLRARVAPLSAWISRALVGPLPVSRRRALWSCWLLLGRSRVQARNMGQTPALLELPGAGRQRVGDPPRGGTRVDLSGLGSLATPKEYWPPAELWQIRMKGHTQLAFPWPEAPPGGALVEVGVQVDDLKSWGELRLLAQDGHPAPFELSLVVDERLPRVPRESFEGWISFTLPRDLLPAPGSQVVATFPTLLGAEVDLVELEGLHLTPR
jgi:hypothetical protein